MNLKQRIGLFEEDSKILEAIAGQYGNESREYAALQHSAIALWYVLAEDNEKFKEYVAKFQGDLSPEQKAHLAEMGIDPEVDPG